jgi:hypothetical protein
MLQKGYPHPLYSLELLPAGEAPKDDPRFSIQAEAGRLYVRAALRRRAQGVSTIACEQVVAVALSRRRLREEAFSQHGLGAEWAEALCHWRDEMVALHKRRLLQASEVRHLSRRGQDLRLRAQAILRRLSLLSRISGLYPHIVPPRPPRALQEILALLPEIKVRIGKPEHRALLLRHGLLPADEEELSSILEDAPSLDGARGEEERKRQALSDGLGVLRAALLGDVAIFCKAADLCLPKDAARGVKMGRLLSTRRNGSG